MSASIRRIAPVVVLVVTAVIVGLVADDDEPDQVAARGSDRPAPATTVAPASRADGDAGTDEGGFGFAASAITLVGGSIALTIGASRSRREGRPQSERDRDRTILIDSMIDVRDVVPSPALSIRLAQSLAQVGVVVDEPVGQPFDASRHRAVGVVDTDDLTLVGVVADVSRAGYVDAPTARTIRPAEVSVYQSDRPS